MASFGRVGLKLTSGQMAVAVPMASGELVVITRVDGGATKAFTALTRANAVAKNDFIAGFSVIFVVLLLGDFPSPLPFLPTIIIGGICVVVVRYVVGDVVNKKRKSEPAMPRTISWKEKRSHNFR